MNVWKKWNDISLVKRILVGLIIGAILGFTVPAGNEAIALLGSLFVGALKAIAPVLVFFLVISALANARSAGSMGTVVILYVVSTLIAALIAVVASYLFPTIVGTVEPAIDQASPEGLGEVISTLLLNVVTNPVGAITNANYLGILAWGVVLGVALRAATQNVKDVFTAISDAVSKVVGWIISFAPFGILGLVYSSVSENGPEIFATYGHLILVLVGCMLFIALVSNPLIVFIATRKNPYRLVLRCLKDSGITAFFTRSSAANIPVNMELCRRLGLEKDNYSVSIPLGATINMAGAAVTITVMTMAACASLSLTVDPVMAFLLSVLAAVSACGASGVAGGSLLLIPLACSLFGIGNDVAMQMVAIGFIIGVVQDSMETAINSSSDVIFTATAEYRDMKKKGLSFEMGKDASGPEPENAIGSVEFNG